MASSTPSIKRSKLTPLTCLDNSLLIHPNPESALHEEAGKLLLEAYDDYARHARLMTDVHARYRPSEFTTTASSTSYQPYATATSSSSSSSTTTTPKLGSLPSLAPTTSLAPLQASNSINGDTVMQDAAVASSEPMKPISSSSSSGTSGVSTIPKKRAAPPTALTSLSPTTALHPGTTASMAAEREKERERERGHAVLGASSAGVSSGNAVKVSQAKKRGLKRL